MLRLAFDFIITWRETRTRPNAYPVLYGFLQNLMHCLLSLLNIPDLQIPNK